MSSDTQIRERICLFGKSLFDRGMTGGASGNLSVRTDDGGLLITPPAPRSGSLIPLG